jgi:hypothetical protein
MATVRMKKGDKYADIFDSPETIRQAQLEGYSLVKDEGKSGKGGKDSGSEGSEGSEGDKNPQTPNEQGKQGGKGKR